MEPDNFSVSETLSMEDQISNVWGDVYFFEELVKSTKGEANEEESVVVWENLAPDSRGLWALNTEILWIRKFTISDNISIRWANPEEVMENSWKMTTTTIGLSVKVEVILDENRKFCREESTNTKTENWTIQRVNKKFIICDSEGDNIPIPSLLNYL